MTTVATSPVSAELARATLAVIRAVADIIRDAGTVPAGTIYAGLMTQGCTLEQFERLIGVLTGAGLVARSPGGMLRWIGPAKA